MQEKPSLPRRILRLALSLLLSGLLIAVFYVAVILGQPQDAGLPEEKIDDAQPLLQAMSSPIRISDSRDLIRLAEAFPAPVMHAAQGTALILVEGECRDLPFEGGLGRTVRLTYRTEDFQLLTIASIYPARALQALMDGGYTFTDSFGKTLAGIRSVPMQNATTLRMHAQGTEALYTFTCPHSTDDMLNLWTSSLQLYEAD
ncbi:MAG: hypothetical protein IJ343_13075 [Clostridia bacterium]|nr:hypothetical protein [Clostridia bacterium]